MRVAGAMGWTESEFWKASPGAFRAMMDGWAHATGRRKKSAVSKADIDYLKRYRADLDAKQKAAGHERPR